MKTKRMMKRITTLLFALIMTISAAKVTDMEVLAATAVNGMGNTVTYTKGGSAVNIDSSVDVTGTVTGTFLQVNTVSGFASGDRLSIYSDTNTNVSGAVSVTGDKVYVGTGTGRIAVATVDAYYNGADGRDLRINFQSDFVNGEFNNVITDGWTTRNYYIDMPYDKPEGYVSTYSTAGDTGTGISTSVGVVSGRAKMTISGSVTVGYGTAHGPSIVSDSFSAKAGEAVSMDVEALKGSDWYDIYGYLLYNGSRYTELFHKIGTSYNGTVTGTIPFDGNWQFEFICGTYDDTGGQAVGATMYVDNVVLETGELAEAYAENIIENVVFSTTSSTVSSSARSYNIQYGNSSGVQYTSANGTIHLKLQAPTVSLTPSTTGMTVAYNAISGAQSYDIYRDGSLIKSGNTTTSYTDSGLGVNTQHSYVVIAKNTGDDYDSAASTTVSKYTLSNKPNISVANQTPDQSRNILTIDPAGNPAGTQYEIQVSVNGGAYTTLENAYTDLTFTHSGLTAGNSYSYQVRAKNGDSTVSAYSSVQSVTVNSTPILTVLAPPENTYNSEVDGYDVFTLGGFVVDNESDAVTVSATVEGTRRETTVNATPEGTAWSLSWDIVDDNIDETSVTSVVVSGLDDSGKSNANGSVTWTKTLYVDKTAPVKPTITTNEVWNNEDQIGVTLVNGSDTGLYQSGASYTEYQLTGDSLQGWTVYNGEFFVTNPGVTTVEARTVDKVGNKSLIESIAIKIDRTAPSSGSFVLRSNDQDEQGDDDVFSRVRTVNLTGITALDAGGAGDNSDASLPYLMEISNTSDFEVSSGWVMYDPTYSGWTLTENDGVKTVYIRFKDFPGNMSDVYSDTIILDSTAPKLFVSTPSNYAARKGATVTYQIILDDDQAYTYGINASDTSKVILSGVGSVVDRIGEIQAAITIEDTDSSHKTIGIHLPENMTEEGVLSLKILGDAAIDKAGNHAIETLGNFSLIIDSTAPVNQNDLFPDDLEVSGGVAVTLNQASSESEAGEDGDSVRFAPAAYDGQDPANGTTITSTHGQSNVINAPTQPGIYYLYILDAAGNISQPSSGVLTVKNDGPTVSVSKPSDDKVQASNTVSYILTYSEDTAEITLGQYDIGLIREGTANAYVTIEAVEGQPLKRRVVLSNLMGEGSVAIKVGAGSAVDAIGNPSFESQISERVYVDNTAPVISEVVIGTNNALDGTYAKEGDLITLSFKVNELLEDNPIVSINERLAIVTMTDETGLHYQGRFQVPEGTSMDNGMVAISIKDVIDGAGNVSDEVTVTSDASQVTLDTLAPELNISGEMDISQQYYIGPVTLTYSEGTLSLYNVTADDTSYPDSGIEIDVAGEYQATLIDAAGNVTLKTFVYSQEYVNALKDYEALIIGYALGDDEQYVTRDINLPMTGALGSTIDWQVTVGSSITSDGRVTRPEGDDENVTLQALIENGTTSIVKTFNLKVIAQLPVDLESLLADDQAVLSIIYSPGDHEDSVTAPVGLKAIGDIQASSIVWTCSDPLLLSIDEAPIEGVYATTLNRPAFSEGDVEISLTATLTIEATQVTKDFDLMVMALAGTDAEMLEMDATSVILTYEAGDDQDHVRNDVLLGFLGDEGTAIEWTSSNPTWASVNNDRLIITRPNQVDGNQTLTVRAVLTRGELAKEVTFELTVLAEDINAVNNEKNMLKDLDLVNIIYRGTDDANHVSTHLILADLGAYGSAITWKTTSPQIESDGTVTLSYVETKVSVIATVTNGEASGSRIFEVTLAPRQIGTLLQIGTDATLAAIVYQDGDNANHVTGDLSLASSGSNGTIITWSSSNESLVTSEGRYISGGGKTVTLTAAISMDGFIIYKSFILTVD